MAAFAAEKDDKIVPITRSREETAISAAKPGVETLKTSRDPALQMKGDVPRLAVPEMAAGGTAPAWVPPKPATAEAKSGNWLVDAVQKQASAEKLSAHDKRERDDLRRGANAPEGDFSPAQKSAPAEPTPPAANNGTREGERKPSPTEVVNPLTRYLGDWMTPQDYALLKPSLATSAANGLGRDAATAGVSPIADTRSMAVGSQNVWAFSPGAGVVAAKPKENPFLQALAPPPVTAQPQAAVNLPIPSRDTPGARPAAAVAPLPAPVAAPARSKVPDFARPTEDEKYFKPLKRF